MSMTATMKPQPPLPPIRLSHHHDNAPQLGCEWAERAAGGHPEETSSSLHRSCREIIRGGPGMRCQQRTGRSDDASDPHLSRPKKNRSNFPCPLPHMTTTSRPTPALSSLFRRLLPEAFGSTAANCGWCWVSESTS